MDEPTKEQVRKENKGTSKTKEQDNNQEPKDAKAYHDRGIVWSHRGDYDKALGNFNQAIRLDPKNAVYYNSRGYNWFKKGKLDKAIGDYDTAIEINPEYRAAYSNRGHAYKKFGFETKAEADFEKAGHNANPKELKKKKEPVMA